VCFLEKPILLTMMMEAIIFSETSFLTRATLRHIPEDDILHSHGRENLNFSVSPDWLIIGFILAL
jgi:hypothetical protein